LRVGTWKVAMLGVGALAALGVGVLLGRAPLRQLVDGPPSIAVLPLANRTGDPSQEYFSDGMTEELIGRFARVGDLRVISRSSVMPFKNSSEPLREIGRKLHVGMVVEGSVARTGNRARVWAQLVDVSSGRAIWAGTFDRDLSDVFALQSDVAKAVVQKVEARLTPGERARLEKASKVNPEAHRLYLQGLASYHQFTAEGVQRAIVLFRQAAEVDPTYSDPWTGLANAYDLAVALALVSQEASYAMALRAAQRAIELDPESGRARAILANVQLDHNWDFAAAERGCRQALALTPGDADMRGDLAIALIQRGNFNEALREAKRASEADPLSLMASAVTLFPLYEARRYDDAVVGARDILVMHPDASWIVLLMGMSLYQDGKRAEGIATLERSVQLDHTPPSVGWLGYAYGHAGHPEKARAVLADLERMRGTSYVDPYYFGIVHLGLGDRSQALTYIEEAGRTHSPEAKLLRVDPVLDPLRREPRFQALLKRLRMS
jgi:TolB-like protein